jgi:general secretion pathway protein I
LSRAASCSSRSQAGFTMIEALVALALVSVMLAAIGSLVGAARKGVRTTEEHLALVETARLVSTTLTERDVTDFGTLAGEVSGYRWRASVSPLAGLGAAAEGPPWIPRRIVVQVQGRSGAVFAVETVRLQKGPGR